MMHPYVYAGLKGSLEKNRTQIIINTICEFFKITPKDLANKSRDVKTIYHRQLVHYFLIKHTTYKQGDILLAIKGVVFGRTTILHSCKAIQDYYDTNEAKRHEIDCLNAVIKNNLNII